MSSLRALQNLLQATFKVTLRYSIQSSRFPAPRLLRKYSSRDVSQKGTAWTLVLTFQLRSATFKKTSRYILNTVRKLHNFPRTRSSFVVVLQVCCSKKLLCPDVTKFAISGLNLFKHVHEMSIICTIYLHQKMPNRVVHVKKKCFHKFKVCQASSSRSEIY